MDIAVSGEDVSKRRTRGGYTVASAEGGRAVKEMKLFAQCTRGTVTPAAATQSIISTAGVVPDYRSKLVAVTAGINIAGASRHKGGLNVVDWRGATCPENWIRLSPGSCRPTEDTLYPVGGTISYSWKPNCDVKLIALGASLSAGYILIIQPALQKLIWPMYLCHVPIYSSRNVDKFIARLLPSIPSILSPI